jgi:hypothetical protein
LAGPGLDDRLGGGVRGGDPVQLHPDRHPVLILAKIALCAGAVWYGVRLIVGVVHLSSDRPYPHPWTLMA